MKVAVGKSMCRVGQNRTHTVYIRYFWLGNHRIYGVYIRIYTVLANPAYEKYKCIDIPYVKNINAPD
jgi:hypothetical protein